MMCEYLCPHGGRAAAKAHITCPPDHPSAPNDVYVAWLCTGCRRDFRSSGHKVRVIA